MKNKLISQLSSEATSPCTGRREQREAANLGRVELMFPPPDPLHKMPLSVSSSEVVSILTFLESSSGGIVSNFLFTPRSAPLQVHLQTDFHSPLSAPSKLPFRIAGVKNSRTVRLLQDSIDAYA